jgi:CYTH domain-containing protein
VEKLKDVKEVVLSGGPCSGKSTAIPYLIEQLQNRGVRLFITPEIPTLIIPGGIPDIGEIGKREPELLYKIQEQFLRAHLEFRNRCRAFADIFHNDKRMILCDRGAVDGDPYVPFGLFWNMVAEHGLRPYDVMESYDGVVYMRSAARLGKSFYTTEDNGARTENYEEAVARDEATLRAWFGHPHLTIIESCENFSAKLRRVLQAALRILGMPVPLEIERKFLLRDIPDCATEAMCHAQKVLIEQTYCLMPDGEEFRIRKRTFRNASVYYKTKKTVINSRVREEYEIVISPLEYIWFQKFRELGTGVIQKERFYFVHNNQYFELDRFLNVPGSVLLEAELTEENDYLAIPPFCDVVREVTDEPFWRNREIARRLQES